MRHRLETERWQLEVVAISPEEPTAKAPYLFAHGKAFNSELWMETGIAQRLAEAGHHVVAFDVPDDEFSASRSEGHLAGQPALLLKGLLGEMGLARPIGVFPSLSGQRIGFPVLEKSPEMLAAAVLPAPVGADAFTPARTVPLSALIIWNEGDAITPVDNALTIASEFDRPVVALADGNMHSVFAQYPERFADLLTWYGEDPDGANSRTAQIYEDSFWHQLPRTEE